MHRIERRLRDRVLPRPQTEVNARRKHPYPPAKNAKRIQSLFPSFSRTLQNTHRSI
jgi:hypothetical protein